MIKRYINIGVGILLLMLISIICIYHNSNQRLNQEISILTANEKAFILENDKLKESNRVFKFTIEQLNYYNDSILDKMNKVRNELKIKDNDLKQMQYLLSESQRKDSIIFKDTLFIDTLLHLDTIVGDKWYQMKLGLRYPSTIITEPKFTSEKYIITSTRKETINPPKKCWFLRLFQKKHKVLEVEVVEKSPYIENKQQKFIEIIE